MINIQICGLEFNIENLDQILNMGGDSDELDHYVPEQTDHLFRAKLTT